jgi:hypothetical protein
MKNTQECAIHEIIEPYITKPTERSQCFECWHVFNTDAEAIDLYCEVYPNNPKPKKLTDIPFCPLCLHDW